jgi:hypothetical protein
VPRGAPADNSSVPSTLNAGSNTAVVAMLAAALCAGPAVEPRACAAKDAAAVDSSLSRRLLPEEVVCAGAEAPAPDPPPPPRLLLLLMLLLPPPVVPLADFSKGAGGGVDLARV